MKKSIIRRILIAGVVMVAPVLRISAAETEFRVVRLGEKAAIFQIGKESPTNVVVLASARGLVVVDTGVVPTRGAALREAIEREFGRKDFAYVVNTHPHYDHIGGNQAFAGVPIIAHQSAAREMNRWYRTPSAVTAFVQREERIIADLGKELKTAAAGSREESRIREQMAENAALADDFRQGRFVLTMPSLAFNDRMTVNLGDLTLNLVYFGRAHTESDILVHVPELRLLVSGDLFFKTWLPSFPGITGDVPGWFQTLDGLPTGAQAVERVVSGHGEMMTGDEFRAQAAYLRDVWDGVTAARREGATLAATRERFPFEKKYPNLTGMVRVDKGRDLHLDNIEAAWRLQSESAAATLESWIAARGLQAAVADFRKTIVGNEKYNLIENELIALGYRYLQSGRTAEALAVFEIVSESFPRSWNAWDSLAEARMIGGDSQGAISNYTKSLELNPENQNGKDALSRLRGYQLDVQGETKEAVRFASGTNTKLRGPYFGQTPPGSKPRVFAPGIVSTSANREFSITFTPDVKEIYFTRRKEGGRNMIMVSRLEVQGWTAPEEAAFNRGYAGNEPFISPDGRKLFFGGNRPRPGVEGQSYGIWVTERTADGRWDEPRYHGPGMYVSTSRSGDLYLTDITMAAGGGAIVFPWTEGGYGAPRKLGGGVNSPRGADHSFIAPDGSFLLFDSYFRPGGQGGEGDLWACFKMADGSWSEAQNLGDTINTPATNFCPSISPDGKYIFYSTCRDIYWVSADILKDLKAKALRPSGQR